jgi:hypothetical protein
MTACTGNTHLVLTFQLNATTVVAPGSDRP